MSLAQPFISQHKKQAALPNTGQSNLLLFHNQHESLASLLKMPYQYFIEQRQHTHEEKALQFLVNEQPDISFCMASDTAYMHPIANYLTKYLLQERDVPEYLSDQIKTCLQESIMNAIIHGNLCIDNKQYPLSDFPKYLEHISHTIGDSSHANKYIYIYGWLSPTHLTLCVSDEGKGFSLTQPFPDEHTPYGRGLIIMRNSCSHLWQQQKNQLYMRFDYNNEC